MLTEVATLLHLDKFHFGEAVVWAGAAAWVWIGIYTLVPLTIIGLLPGQLRVRGTDPPKLAPLPSWSAWILGVQAAVLLPAGVALFVAPTHSTWWPWMLTPLTSQAVGAWLIGIGVGLVHAIIEADLEPIRPGLVAFTVLGALQLIALARYAGDVDWSRAVTWIYLGFVVSALLVGADGCARGDRGGTASRHAARPSVTKPLRPDRSTGTIDAVLERFEATFPPPGDEKRHFHGVYYRNTIAVKEDLERGRFLDPAWLEPWDVIFANLYLDALEMWNRGERPSRPWQVAFKAANDPVTSPLVHVLIGLNAHLNYDLPQALLAVVTDQEFTDAALIRRRYRDFKHIDDIVVRRVKEEDLELQKVEEPGDRTLLDRVMTPLNRSASKRFLKEARYKVWRNAIELSKARRLGPEAYAARLRELEEVCRAKVADLTRPGKVLVRLGVEGYGVLLGPPTPTVLGNPAGWPAGVLGAFDSFKSAEYATVTRRGGPVCHPLTPYVGEDGRTLAVSCGLTSPAKAERARRNPKVCLLYSNPTGSGLTDPPVVLVYGTAAVRDRDIQRNTDRYIRWSLGKIPAPWRGIPRSWMRMLDWYWSRIWIEVTPERIVWWPGDLDEQPEEWVGPDGTIRPESDPPPSGRQPAAWRDGAPEWRSRAVRVVRDFPPPVVTAIDADGWPVPFRAASCTFDGEGFALRMPDGRPVDPSGVGCLTFQRHDPDFRNYENVIFAGAFTAAGDGVAFAVDRALPDVSLTGSWARRARGFVSNARLLRGRVAAEAARRGQPPPTIRIPRYW